MAARSVIRAGRQSKNHIWHRGLTLVEVVLVLALLVVIGALSIPLMEGFLSRATLQSSSELLRGAWAKARFAAIQSGSTHVFRFEPGGRRFQIVSLGALGTPANTELQPVDPEAAPDADSIVRLSENRLGDGIVFARADVSSSAHVVATLPMVADGPWSQPILFHPDGTTSDASVLISNGDQKTIRVTLRGLTGVAHAADVENEAVP
jgi:Tfp pilus assembly protein FimT